MNDISKLGTIQAFNHLDYNKYFSGECSKLKGSTGELFPPQQSKESNLWLFVPDMCRAIPFDYEKKVCLYWFLEALAYQENLLLG